MSKGLSSRFSNMHVVKKKKKRKKMLLHFQCDSSLPKAPFHCISLRIQIHYCIIKWVTGQGKAIHPLKCRVLFCQLHGFIIIHYHYLYSYFYQGYRYVMSLLLSSFGASFFPQRDVDEQCTEHLAHSTHSTQHSQISSKGIKLVRKWPD